MGFIMIHPSQKNLDSYGSTPNVGSGNRESQLPVLEAAARHCRRNWARARCTAVITWGLAAGFHHILNDFVRSSLIHIDDLMT
jgi:hypothetical protein